MKGRGPRHIGTSFLLSLGVLVLVASAAAGFFVYAMVQSTLINQSVAEVSSVAHGAVRMLTYEQKLHRGRTLAEDMADLATTGTYVLLTTPEGQFLLSKGVVPPSQPARGWALVPASGWLQVQNVPYAYARVPLILSGKPQELIVVREEAHVEGLLQSLRDILLLAEALLMVSLLLGIHLVVRDLTKPLERLRDFADKVARNPGLQERLDAGGGLYEVDLVTSGFNQMLDRLALAQERERQFASNAAHALRTPVQVIQGYLQTLSRWGRTDPETRSRALAALLAEASGMAELIERLLVLSRLDSDSTTPMCQAVALTEFLRVHGPEFNDTCMRHALVVEAEPDLVVWTDEALLLTLLRTLLENGDAYAYPDSVITLSAHRVGPGVDIRVTNQGPSIPSGEIPSLFERFQRGRESADSRHYGLGLAIADRIREQLHARWIVGSDDKETVFGMVLPCLDADLAKLKLDAHVAETSGKQRSPTPVPFPVRGLNPRD